MISSFRFFAFAFLVTYFASAQDTTSCCQTTVKDATATVTLENNAFVKTENDSYVYYRQTSSVVLKSDASQTLKIQSGFRTLEKAVVEIGSSSQLSYTESSHLTVKGKLLICRDSKFTFDASRALIMGTADFSARNEMEMYDSSVFRVWEGGRLQTASDCKLNLYRSAQLAVSEWWQPLADLDDVRSKLVLNNNSKVELLDRSNFQVALGCFEALGQVSIKLEDQAEFFSKGMVNVTDGSGISLAPRSQVLIGTKLRNFDKATMPSFVFSKNNLQLNLGPQASLTVELGAHCMLVKSANINDKVVLTSTSTDKDFVGCFKSASELSSAMSAL